MVEHGTCVSEPCAAPKYMPPAGVPPNMPTCVQVFIFRKGFRVNTQVTDTSPAREPQRNQKIAQNMQVPAGSHRAAHLCGQRDRPRVGDARLPMRGNHARYALRTFPEFSERLALHV